MPRTRTTKKLAQRIDLNYFLSPAPLRHWRFWLSVAALALAARVARLARVGGRRARLFERKCRSRARRAYGALRSLPRAHNQRISPPPRTMPRAWPATTARRITPTPCFTPSCASCHVEHRGALRLAATADASCTQCHADLHTRAGAPQFVRTSRALPRAIRSSPCCGRQSGDPTTIKLNHYRHMQPNLAGPNGPVQLACDDCHRAPADTRGWNYGDAAIPRRCGTGSDGPAGAAPSRAYMAAPVYAKACAGCHTLQFDKRFSEDVPHDTPEVIHAFLVQKFQAYIAAHPAELREARQPDRDLPEKTLAPRLSHGHAGGMGRGAHCRKPSSCFGARPASSATRCSSLRAPRCRKSVRARFEHHARFMPHARFDHSAHELLDCAGCHVRADRQPGQRPNFCCRASPRARSAIGPARRPRNRAASSATPITTRATRHPAPGRFKRTDLAATAVTPSLSDADLTARK